MLYSMEKYKFVLEPQKKIDELVIVKKVINMLNKKIYMNIDDFILKNHNYNLFLQINNIENIMLHFSNSVTNNDFITILSNLKMQIQNLDNNILNSNNNKYSIGNISSQRNQQKQYTLKTNRSTIYDDRKEDDYE